MHESGAFGERDIQRAIAEIQDSTGAQQIGVGIKNVLEASKNASLAEDKAGVFANRISQAIAEGGM